MLAVFTVSLLLIACPSPGGGGGTSTSDGGGNAVPDGGKPTPTPTPPTPDPEKPTPEPPTPPPKPKAWHVTTFAGGSGSSNVDGISAAASFTTPFFIIQSGTTLYITDRSSNSLRSIDTTTARVGTLVKGNIIGGHANGAGEAAGASTTQARFNAPLGVAAADAGTLYVADSSNHRIRRVAIGAAAAATQVSDFAGSGTQGHANAAGTAAQFNNPVGIAIGGTTLYVSETGNQRIRAIDIASGAVSDLAGSTAGHANGTGAAARFNSPGGLAISGDTLYVADINNQRIRAVDIPSGVVSDVAGSGTAGYADGAGADARFSSPTGIAVNETGTTLYVADRGNHRIRAIDIATKTVRTIAGDGTSGTKNGLGTAARFQRPTGIVVSGSMLYVTTINAGLIRKLEYREVGS